MCDKTNAFRRQKDGPGKHVNSRKKAPLVVQIPVPQMDDNFFVSAGLKFKNRK